MKKENFCCHSLFNLLIEDKVAFGYSKRFRSYYLLLKGQEKATQRIYYCPWCGTKLPKDLDEEYDIELSKELKININDITYDTYTNPNIPKEFRTDEWWKKRGL